MTKKKPKPDVCVVQEMNDYLADDLNRFIFELYNRTRSLVDDSDLPKAAIAFEMFQSAFSAFEGDLGHAELSAAYPVKAWREDTVEIPRAWLRVLVEGWAAYKNGPSGSTLGEAMGIEGGGQGKLPVRVKLENMKAQIRLSNAALMKYLALQAEGDGASWEKAYFAVAKSEGVSADTVKRASELRRKAVLERMAAFGILTE